MPARSRGAPSPGWRWPGLPDRLVVHEDDSAERFHIIVRGKVEMSRRLSDGVIDKVVVLADGEHFGEVALLRKTPLMATVRTLSDCTLLSLAGEHFQKVMEDVPELREELEEAVEEMLRLPEFKWAVPLLRPEQSVDSEG